MISTVFYPPNKFSEQFITSSLSKIPDIKLIKSTPKMFIFIF